MSVSRAAAAGAALALSGMAVLGLQSPAYANHRCPNPAGNYPTGQCNTEGHGDNAGGGGSVQKDEKIKCHGSGYKPNSQGSCYAKSTPILLGFLTADSTGVIDGAFSVPAGLPLGAHSVVLTGVDPQGRPRTTVTSFTLVAAGGASGAGNNNGVGGVQLPRTGTEIATVGLLGVGLVGAGAFAVVSGRRRRSAV